MSAEAQEPEFINLLCEDEHLHWPLFDGDRMDGACGAPQSFVFVTKPGRVTCPKCKTWLAANPWVAS